MLEKTMMCLNTLEETYQAGNAEFKKAEKTASDMFIGSALEGKIADLKAVLHNSRMDEIKRATEEIKADFAEVRKSLSAIATASVPDDFLPTLAVVQAKGKDITESEALALISKYSGNYLAVSSLISVLHENNKAMAYTVKDPSSILKSMDELEPVVHDWINLHVSDTMNGLANAIMCSDSASPVASVARQIADITENGFVV